VSITSCISLHRQVVAQFFRQSPHSREIHLGLLKFRSRRVLSSNWRKRKFGDLIGKHCCPGAHWKRALLLMEDTPRAIRLPSSTSICLLQGRYPNLAMLSICCSV